MSDDQPADLGSPAVVANDLLALLAEYGAYLYHAAQTGSMYIKFPDSRLGSIRVADHEGRKRYSYRRVVRVDKTGHWAERHHTTQWYYGIDQLDRLVEDVKQDDRIKMFKPRIVEIRKEDDDGERDARQTTDRQSDDSPHERA